MGVAVAVGWNVGAVLSLRWAAGEKRSEADEEEEARRRCCCCLSGKAWEVNVVGCGEDGGGAGGRPAGDTSRRETRKQRNAMANGDKRCV